MTSRRAVRKRCPAILLIDDPHKPEDAVSEVRRNAVLDWFRSTLLSRQNDPARSAIVLIQQRVHENDLASMLLEQGGYRLKSRGSQRLVGVHDLAGAVFEFRQQKMNEAGV